MTLKLNGLFIGLVFVAIILPVLAVLYFSDSDTRTRQPTGADERAAVEVATAYIRQHPSWTTALAYPAMIDERRGQWEVSYSPHPHIVGGAVITVDKSTHRVVRAYRTD
jgi:hypothetical protein